MPVEREFRCPKTGRRVRVGRRDLLYVEHVHFIIARDDGGYSALCYEFNVAACGDTWLEAEDNLAGVLVEYLRYLADEGRLREAIRPATDELVVELLGLDPERLRGPVLQELRKVTLEEAESRACARLEWPPSAGHFFQAPTWACSERVLNYPVEVTLQVG
jgi:predicted RNase H-like HicB family nuclease